MEALLTLENGLTLGLWVVLGAALAWGRNIRLSVAVPLVVTGLPALVVVGSSGISFAAGVGAAELLPLVGVPLVGGIIGGYAGVAIAPARRTKRSARIAYEQARREAERVGAEIYRLGEEVSRPAPIEIASPTSPPVLYDVKSVRTRLALHEDRLRAIGRALTEAG